MLNVLSASVNKTFPSFLPSQEHAYLAANSCPVVHVVVLRSITVSGTYFFIIKIFDIDRSRYVCIYAGVRVYRYIPFCSLSLSLSLFLSLSLSLSLSHYLYVNKTI